MISPRRFAITTAACRNCHPPQLPASVWPVSRIPTHRQIEERATTTGEAGIPKRIVDRRSSGRDCRGRVAGRFADAPRPKHSRSRSGAVSAPDPVYAEEKEVTRYR